MAPAHPAGGSVCRECGAAYKATDLAQEFCRPACRIAWNNRARLRGAKLYEAVMTWRVLRQPGALAVVTALVSTFLDEDRAAGRRWRPRTFNPKTGRRERRK
ncbi:hypothetical protein [Azospirillum picis]|uniref:Transcriptional regulator n=1 Tax=Azospirillum picis TaxID=488438 RepID=A0ABU0MEF5_9PROT|nr:hypothetical protein [Azospirillum picis]MBP2297984.1 hypothetical protein [Azospirillum picis]MDQ0531822.1 hypothetical protein [Azospirillum picis]